MVPSFATVHQQRASASMTMAVFHITILMSHMSLVDGLVVPSYSTMKPADFNEHNIIAEEGRGWMKIPDPFTEGRPHPPKEDYRSQEVRNASKVVVLIAAMRETRLAETLRTLFAHASNPSRVYAAVVQQNGPRDRDALEDLCRSLGTPLELKQEFRNRDDLNERQEDEDAWGHQRYTPRSFARCEPAARVRMHRMNTDEAQGPLYARARQPMLLSSGDAMEDFCMQIDAHTVFLKGWDEQLLNEWTATDNEYAVLSTYPTGADQLLSDYTAQNSNGHWEMPHLCHGAMQSPGYIRNDRASAVANLDKPVLSKLWGAGLSFSKCHAERDVPNDPNLAGIFFGEEFLRGARLWTNGYDLYTITRPAIVTYYESAKQNPSISLEDAAKRHLMNPRMRHQRVKPTHDVSQRAQAVLRYENTPKEAYASLEGYDLGTRRRIEDYIALTGMDTKTWRQQRVPCAVERWVPWLPSAQAPYEMLKNSPVQLGTAFKESPIV